MNGLCYGLGRRSQRHAVRIEGFLRIFGLIIRIVMVSAGLAASPVSAQTQPDFRKLELEAIENSLKETEANRSRLKSEIDAIAMDRASLNARLNDVAKRVQQQEAKVSEVEQRLKLLGETEAALRKSLDERRGLLSQVLATLQRMGRKPPPAILVKPEDMLEALHAALLVGSVLPDLQHQV